MTAYEYHVSQHEAGQKNPATGKFDLIFFISMFGEVGMALFFLLYADKKQAVISKKWKEREESE